jgi:TonB dependent receptor-like, beta-barrel/Carboxypeptidase regulatory-like domain
MGTPTGLVPALMLALTLAASPAAAQMVASRGPERITNIAASLSGHIEGTVLDEAGRPLDGVVISALGGTTVFAVSDKSGQFILRQLPPGPYLVRAHLQGFLTPRSTIVNVRPAVRTPSSFTLRREGPPDAPRVVDASVGATQIDAPPAGPRGRDESEMAWKLRHLKRSVLRDTTTMAYAPAEDNDEWFLRDSIDMLGRAFGNSAKAAGALFSDLSIAGQVNLLTTGAFDSPLQLLELDRTNSVAFFSLGAPVGSHGNWSVRAAMNQTDLSSWTLAGNYAVNADVPHRYQFGMSYSLQRYEGGNAIALATLSDTARNVGSIFAVDEWRISPQVTVGYGASYAHYDYLLGPSLFSPTLSATLAPSKNFRVRVSAARIASAPGAEEFLPPSRAEYLPPQRTFSPLSRATGFRTEQLDHFEIGVERVMNGASIRVRTFREQIDNQLVTVFGLRSPDAEATAVGHYYVGSAGDADVTGFGVTFTHALLQNVRGSIDYSVASAMWLARPTSRELTALERWVPGAIRGGREQIHDVTTSLQTEIPCTATRFEVLYKLNNAFTTQEGDIQRPGFDARFDVRVNQALPFMNFRTSQWEMLVAVRNLFHESLSNVSSYDELLVVRPPKRIVGGLTVKF